MGASIRRKVETLVEREQSDSELLRSQGKTARAHSGLSLRARQQIWACMHRGYP